MDLTTERVSSRVIYERLTDLLTALLINSIGDNSHFSSVDLSRRPEETSVRI